jgi:cell surface protein SprA
VPYFKRILSGQPRKADAAAYNKKNLRGAATSTNISKSATKALTDSTNPRKNENFKDVLELLARGLMMIKNISINYQLQGGQGLPNFKPSSQYMGMDFADKNKQAPGFLFTTGWYDETIRQRSAQNGWLARVPLQTTPYSETRSETFTYRSSIEPHGSFKIELNGNLTHSKNISEYMIYDPANAKPGDGGFVFDQSRNETGNFNISTFTFFRSLSDRGRGPESSLFTEFISERRNVANELGAKNAASSSNPLGSQGEIIYTNVLGQNTSYIDGYDNNQQDVLLGAFYRTYTGRKIKNYSTQNIFPNIPLPNWTASWDGLSKIPILKKTFRSITVRHGYRSTYNVSGYSNNLLFSGNEQTARMPIAVSSGTTSLNPNFVPYYTINAITLTESFSPLIKFDLQFVKQGWSANIETKRDKTTSLNITLPQIIETKGQEYILGIGYMYPKLKIKGILIQGKSLESNLLVKIDVSYRRNLSIIRRVDDINPISTPTGGTNIISLRSSADYQLTQNINLRLFCDWIKTIPQTSASFPTSNTTGGFSLRINFQ